MELKDVLFEIRKKIDEYNTTSLHLTRTEIQKYRDELSHLNATLSYFKRKLGVAKKAEELLKSKQAKSSTHADRMAIIACEQLYEDEAISDSANTRCKLIREQVSGVLNSIASRMNIPHD